MLSQISICGSFSWDYHICSMEEVKRIWKSWAPLKCKFSVWLTVKNRCWTADCLYKRCSPHPAASCPFCDQAEETAGTAYSCHLCFISMGNMYYITYIKKMNFNQGINNSRFSDIDAYLQEKKTCSGDAYINFVWMGKESDIWAQVVFGNKILGEWYLRTGTLRVWQKVNSPHSEERRLLLSTIYIFLFLFISAPHVFKPKKILLLWRLYNLKSQIHMGAINQWPAQFIIFQKKNRKKQSTINWSLGESGSEQCGRGRRNCWGGVEWMVWQCLCWGTGGPIGSR